MAKGVPSSCGILFFYGRGQRHHQTQEGGRAMQQINMNKESEKTVRESKPIGFRYSCGLNGSNTGLSHYILLDKKN
jgi:modified peptide precursor CbpA